MSKIEELIKKLCPNGVEYKTIGELFDVKNGYTPSKNNKYFWENGNIPWFRMDDIRTNGNILNDATQHITELAIKNRKFPKDSLIVATTATIGVHALIKCDFVCNQQLTCVAIKEKLKNDLNIKFCFYYFDIIDEQCKKIANQGGGMPIVSLEKMKKLVFPVPPLEVQCEIVHILDDFTLLSAELSAELKARKNQYNYYLEKLLCNDKNAKTYKLKELCVFFNGDRGKNYPKVSEMVNKGVPFVNAGDVNRVIDYKNCNKITLEKYNSMNGAKLRKNDILYCLRGSTGKNGIYELDDGTVASSLVAIRVNSIINYKYLYYLLNSSLERRQRYKSDTGAAQPNLSVQSISNYEFPVPNMEEQNKIVNILDKFEKLCNDISEGLPAEIEARQKQYEYYRDKLLTFKELKVNE